MAEALGVGDGEGPGAGAGLGVGAACESLQAAALRLSDVKNAQTRSELTELVEGLLRDPRSPDRELALLDAVRARERHDEVEAWLSSVTDLDQSTPRSRFERWHKLKDWGLGRLAEATRQGRKTIDLSFSVRASRMYPAEGMATDLRWATEFLSSTDALYAPARTAGFGVESLKPLHQLIRSLREILEGEAVDVHDAVKAVELIVDELIKGEGQPAQSDKPPPPPPVVEAMAPALRVGQMPARVLVTLHKNNGSMTKRDLHRLHRGDKRDDPNLANLLTRRGPLAMAKLVVSNDRTVTLTSSGLQEARLQLAAKTRPLGEQPSGDSRSAHDES